MKILQIAPLYESVPPKYYGGTERIVSYLTEEFVKAGHEVVLFASGDSVSEARLHAQVHRGLRFHKGCTDHIVHHILMLEKIWQTAHDFDIIHSHIDYLCFSLFRRIRTPSLTTLHGRLDLTDLVSLYKEFKDVPLISISNSQRTPLPEVNWQGTVYNGIPKDLYSFQEKQGNYLAFLGRISPEKRVDTAIEISKRVGIPLKIAAKVDKVDQDYFKSVVKPLMDSPQIEYLGEIGDAEKNDFLGNAYALLFPIDWPEPFGLVMIEAMACGTPVIAKAYGSVPEVLKHGENGFIISNVEEAVLAIQKISSISRQRCRESFEKRFTAEHMARGYMKIYKKMMQERDGHGPENSG